MKGREIGLKVTSGESSPRSIEPFCGLSTKVFEPEVERKEVRPIGRYEVLGTTQKGEKACLSLMREAACLIPSHNDREEEEGASKKVSHGTALLLLLFWIGSRFQREFLVKGCDKVRKTLIFLVGECVGLLCQKAN